jgi:Tetratricopeptide Repeats-Sensor
MASNQQGTSNSPKRCFVVMGFGVKTDYATGRKLDLNKSYRLLIKPVVEEKGLVCVRADEIRHSGTIDVPMYQELLMADVVIADLSTANPNAIYELGIRHALRPRTTIVVSENKLPYPFDLNHVAITSYTHLGEAIDYDEVTRFRGVLGETLEAVLREERTDSPVYTFLSQLTPPLFGKQAAQAVAQAGQALERAGEAVAKVAPSLQTSEPDPGETTLSVLIDQGEQAIKNSRFSNAKAFFALALNFCKAGTGTSPGSQHNDPYLVQRLVLATYKAKEPDEVSALNEAMNLLDSQLNLKDSNDPETVGLAGAIEKRLFDQGQGAEHINRAIWYYGRGYYLRNDRYNGINLAFLLNARANTSLDATKEDQIADLVWANRIRRDLLALCEQEVKEIRERESRIGPNVDSVRADQKAYDSEQKFWCLATKAEAYFGLGQLDDHERILSEMRELGAPKWMIETFGQQIEKLRNLLAKTGLLLNPPWPGAGSGQPFADSKQCA